MIHHPAEAHGTTGPAWRIDVHTDPAALDAATWNRLLQASGSPTPFMRHEWLSALHTHGCATPDTGWSPLFLSAQQTGTDAPEGVCALYLKHHSYGEYVFDWAWAQAYERAGLRYYPKLLCASPFTPVPGARLLASGPEARQALLHGITQWVREAKLSSAHLLFPSQVDADLAVEEGWLMRQGVQFHWLNRHVPAPHTTDAPSTADLPPFADFPDFLSSLHRDKRKKIQQERRKVADAGVRTEVLEGHQIDEDAWDFFYRCYEKTYLAHGNAPYLTREFFHEVGRTLAPHWLMCRAWQGDAPVACSLVAIDRAQGVAWGRHWGALEHIPCLHFELCYYAPLAWCIEQGFVRFEGGAQGEHKMARGLRPVPMRSAHWLADARFTEAVADFLAREGAGMDGYLDELNDRTPFKAQQSPD